MFYLYWKLIIVFKNENGDGKNENGDGLEIRYGTND